MITIDAVDLTLEEISFIKTRHTTKQLAFALLFKCYQGSHKFVDDLTKVPGHIINQVPKLVDLPPTIGKVSSRTYDNYISFRQEIQEGLNVVELWNGVSKFIFYGLAGEISSTLERAQ